MASPATSIRWISGHWHLVVTVNGSEQAYPAPSKLEAEIMAVRERRRLTSRPAGEPSAAHAEVCGKKDAETTGETGASTPYDPLRH